MSGMVVRDILYSEGFQKQGRAELGHRDKAYAAVRRGQNKASPRQHEAAAFGNW